MYLNLKLDIISKICPIIKIKFLKIKFCKDIKFKNKFQLKLKFNYKKI